MPSPHYIQTGRPFTDRKSSSRKFRGEFVAIETGLEVMNSFVLPVFFEDLNLVGSRYCAVPWNCLLVGLRAVNHGANGVATTVSVLVNGAASTPGSFQFVQNAPLDTAVEVDFTDGNALQAGQAVGLTSDGAGATVMPATVSLIFKRTVN